MKGEVPEYNHKYTEAMKYLKRVKVKIPFANLVDLYFPEQNIIMRTHYPRFLDFIKASCAFYQYQRKADEEGFLLAEGQDYDIARECFLKLCSNKYMVSLTINQKKILSLFESEPCMKGSASQLHSGKMGFMALKNLQDNLQKLVTYGILQTERDVDKYGRDLEVYFLAQSYDKNQTVNIPNFEDLIAKKDVYLGIKCNISTKNTQQTKILL